MLEGGGGVLETQHPRKLTGNTPASEQGHSSGLLPHRGAQRQLPQKGAAVAGNDWVLRAKGREGRKVLGRLELYRCRHAGGHTRQGEQNMECN